MMRALGCARHTSSLPGKYCSDLGIVPLDNLVVIVTTVPSLFPASFRIRLTIQVNVPFLRPDWSTCLGTLNFL